jgi:hypothetical protein
MNRPSFVNEGYEAFKGSGLPTYEMPAGSLSPNYAQPDGQGAYYSTPGSGNAAYAQPNANGVTYETADASGTPVYHEASSTGASGYYGFKSSPAGGYEQPSHNQTPYSTVSKTGPKPSSEMEPSYSFATSLSRADEEGAFGFPSEYAVASNDAHIAQNGGVYYSAASASAASKPLYAQVSNNGEYAQASAGEYSQASNNGEYAQASAGEYAQASNNGEYAQASAGEYAQASAGVYAQASSPGEYSVPLTVSDSSSDYMQPSSTDYVEGCGVAPAVPGRSPVYATASPSSDNNYAQPEDQPSASHYDRADSSNYYSKPGSSRVRIGSVVGSSSGEAVYTQASESDYVQPIAEGPMYARASGKTESGVVYAVASPQDQTYGAQLFTDVDADVNYELADNPKAHGLRVLISNLPSSLAGYVELQ